VLFICASLNPAPLLKRQAKMVIDSQTLDEAWQQVWQTLAPNQAMPDLQTVLNAYAQPQRHYHTTQHLQECLLWWQRCQNHMQAPAEVALALFYHDIVYDPKRSDNELQSANTMLAHLQAYLPEASTERIYRWILATAHHGQQTTLSDADDADLKWVLDIDLGILSADAERFQEYERQIRMEYRHVPLLIYRCKRRQVLRDFAQAPHLYHTDYFRNQLERAAKANLQAV
jgi:predicted metal-dependent HD superfamily phosphohydrolase